MNNTNRILSTLFTTLVLMTCAPALLAVEMETSPFWEVVSCDSEDIEIEGTVRFQAHAVDNGNHNTWVFQAFWKGDAWGLESGTDYKLMGKWMEVIQGDQPFVFLWNDHFQLIGKGSAPNYRFYYKIRIVINANGEMVMDLEDDLTPCETIAP